MDWKDTNIENPLDGVDVLAFNDGEIQVAALCSGFWSTKHDNYNGVSFWMPLPPNPE